MDWTEAENRLIVEDHFSMLKKQLGNIPYSKSEHRRLLQQKIDRSDASIEFKHRNISAILELFGFETLTGYLPAKNYQTLLAQIIDEMKLIAKLETQSTELENTYELSESAALFAEQPPEKLLHSIGVPEDIRRIARKYDPVLRDLHNRQLGIAGERRIYEREIELLKKGDRLDLAKKVEWTSQEQGDGAGYDIKSFSADGTENFIEVKTTFGSKRTPFYISDNEVEFSREAAHRYKLTRLYDFRREPKLYELRAPLDSFVFLSPVVYRAGFGEM
jgi:hypothetical protein